MRRLAWSGSLIVLLIGGALLGRPIGSTVAQDASPAALDIPDPSDCTVEPRSEDDLRTLYREAVALLAEASPEAGPTPGTPPTGDPADEQVLAQINATWRTFIACINAGDLPRAFALISDDKLREDFVFDAASGATEDDLVAYFMATPVPLPATNAAPFFPFEDGRVLPDGRVAVVGSGAEGQGEVLIFINEGDRWLVDAQFDLMQSGTPEAATPAA